MRATDRMILAARLPWPELPGWQKIGNACYSPPLPDDPIRIIITVHHGSTSHAPLGLILRALQSDRGELDCRTLDFGQDANPWAVAAFNFTHGTVTPGPAFAAYWQRVHNYLGC
ncbi:hypothetical protein P8605_08700 [Streptomyces sp. T-3]|nr:hypothetical protein [Streptomyces sp. T-3]